jgi:hypothetical protein
LAPIAYVLSESATLYALGRGWITDAEWQPLRNTVFVPYIEYANSDLPGSGMCWQFSARCYSKGVNTRFRTPNWCGGVSAPEE